MEICRHDQQKTRTGIKTICSGGGLQQKIYCIWVARENVNEDTNCVIDKLFDSIL